VAKGTEQAKRGSAQPEEGKRGSAGPSPYPTSSTLSWDLTWTNTLRKISFDGRSPNVHRDSYIPPSISPSSIVAVERDHNSNLPFREKVKPWSQFQTLLLRKLIFRSRAVDMAISNIVILVIIVMVAGYILEPVSSVQTAVNLLPGPYALINVVLGLTVGKLCHILSTFQL
jgi:hypothetical protein